MIGCSGSHRDSKPSDSALCARTATSIDWLESVIFTPIFISPSVHLRVPHCAKRLLQYNESIGLCSAVARTHPLSPGSFSLRIGVASQAQTERKGFVSRGAW